MQRLNEKSLPYIDVSRLCKSFRLGERASLLSWLRYRGEIGKIQAVDEVSFAIHPGEIVGLVGPNGAGKSTLLRILARLTPPSKGKVILRGRVAPLFNAGVGFHDELTGRENLFFASAILGMSRTETLGKLDSIVSMAGIERFLDTPVKRYSVGMTLRLGISIAFHQDGELLLVDEVLAAADIAFQKKVLDSMTDFAARGGAILIVSHQQEIVLDLCERVILLESGRVSADGPSETVLEAYRAKCRDDAEYVYE